MTTTSPRRNSGVLNLPRWNDRSQPFGLGTDPLPDWVAIPYGSCGYMLHGVGLYGILSETG
jgi:hypothetical protein